MPTLAEAMQQEVRKTREAPEEARGSTERLQQVLQQLSGKAAPAGGAPTQNLLEEGAIANAKATQAEPAADQLAQQAAVQQGVTEQRQQGERIQQQRDQEKSQSIRDHAANQAAATLAALREGRMQLNLAKDRAKAEQLGFDMRLGNEKYIHNLQQVGAQKRLDDQQKFEEELLKSVFGEQLALLKDQIDWNTILLADDLAFQEQLASIDMDTWVAMANIEAKEQGAASIAKGISTGVTAGANYYAKRGPEDEDTQ